MDIAYLSNNVSRQTAKEKSAKRGTTREEKD